MLLKCCPRWYNPLTMNRRVSRALFLIPVAYVGVIFLLFFLQYYGDEVFRESIGDLSISGRMARSGNGGSVANAVVTYPGLSFTFSDETGIVLSNGGDQQTALSIRSYEIHEDGLELLFDQDVRLSFSLARESEQELYVQPVLPQDVLPVDRVLLEYQVIGELAEDTQAVQTTLTIASDSQTYYLTLPPRSEINVEDGRIVVPGDLERQTIRYTRMLGDPEDVVSVWFADDSLAIPDAEIQAIESEFIDSAYDGWQRRLNSGSGTWEMKSGSAEFRESILVAYLAEAWRRDQYTRAFNAMRRAADLHPESIGLESAVFLGNLREVRAAFLERDRRRSQDLLQRVRARDATIFRDPGLLEFAVNRGNEVLLRELLDFVASVDFRDVGVLTAIGMLGNYHASARVSEQFHKQLSRFRPIAEEIIIPSLVKAGEGFFVQSAQGQVDLRYSLYAGVLLENFEGSDGRSTTIGRNLIRSVLDLADDAGFLPEVLLVGEGIVRQTEGRIGPEDVYRFITENPAYPRTVSLYDELGAGAWVRVVVPILSLETDDETFTLRIDNVPNRTHYVILQGIPEFSSMQLFGLTWRNAPDFEIYSKGRHYNPETNTLMIKYYDDDPIGNIVLRF